MSRAADGVTGRRRLVVLLPLLVFLGLAALFFVQLLSGRDGSVVPSVLIGAPAPATVLPPLDGIERPGLDSAAMAGKVWLLNVFASWCAPCREEHPVLMELSKDPRFELAALNYKDGSTDARRFLGELGNPYDAVGVDPRGRAAIEWGVYGVPETFLVGRDGTVLYKHVGPLTPEAVERDLMPAIESALSGAD